MKVSFAFLAVLVLLISDVACADQSGADDSGASAERSASSVDPLQSYNRTMFIFNEHADKYVFKPIAKTYVKVTPGFFRQGVNNVFSNIMEVPSALNGVLQGNFPSAAHDTGRLLVNTTLGIAGIFDVAQYMGLKNNNNEDFGQTLAVWGVGSGPYIVLPFLGPSTIRDSFALPADWYMDPKGYIDHVPTRNTVRGVSLVNTRANLIPLEKSITGDKYIFIRDVYLQHREYEIKNGQVEDGFGLDGDDEGSE